MLGGRNNNGVERQKEKDTGMKKRKNKRTGGRREKRERERSRERAGEAKVGKMEQVSCRSPLVLFSFIPCLEHLSIVISIKIIRIIAKIPAMDLSLAKGNTFSHHI